MRAVQDDCAREIANLKQRIAADSQLLKEVKATQDHAARLADDANVEAGGNRGILINIFECLIYKSTLYILLEKCREIDFFFEKRLKVKFLNFDIFWSFFTNIFKTITNCNSNSIH